MREDAVRPGRVQGSPGRLRAGLEAKRQQGLSGRGASVHGKGLESPLLYRVNGRAGKRERTLQKLSVLYGTVAANQHLQDNRSLLAFRSFGINRLRLLQQK